MSNKHVAVLAALGTLALAAGVSSASAAPATTTTIASASAGGFRAVVTASKTGGGGAPAATVTLTAFAKSGGKWASLGQVRVGRPDGFFWKVLTGPRAIRQFSIGTAVPERVTVQLLVTPSLGWSPVYQFHVASGRLVAGAAR